MQAFCKVPAPCNGRLRGTHNRQRVPGLLAALGFVAGGVGLLINPALLLAPLVL